MYTLKQREKAVKMIVDNSISYRKVIKMLGYPDSRTTLTKWVEEYKSKGELIINYTRKPRFTMEQRREVVEYYFSVGESSSKSIQKFGYPSRSVLLK